MNAAKLLYCFVFLAMSLGRVSIAVAQTQAKQSSTGADIVVTGSPEDRDRRIQDFVRGMTLAPGTDPMARFDDGDDLCPGAFGLGGGYDQAVTKRLRRVASALRVHLAREGCRYPNAVVIFSEDKSKTIAELNKRYPWLFRDSHGDPIKPKERGPVAAWHVNGVVNHDGVHLPPVSEGVSRSIFASRARSIDRPVYLMSVVVIERTAVDGLTMAQIGDYAAMRAYSDADPDRTRDIQAPTILTLLDTPAGGKAPPSMTSWDFGFLRGFYRSPPYSSPSAQRGAIDSYMKRELDRETGGEK